MSTLLPILFLASFCTAFALNVPGCQKPLSHVPVTENVTFEKHIRPLTTSHCTECHWQYGQNFALYEDVYWRRLTIKQKVVVEKSMPRGRYLSDEDRALFRDWADQGGKK